MVQLPSYFLNGSNFKTIGFDEPSFEVLNENGLSFTTKISKFCIVMLTVLKNIYTIYENLSNMNEDIFERRDTL